MASKPGTALSTGHGLKAGHGPEHRAWPPKGQPLLRRQGLQAVTCPSLPAPCQLKLRLLLAAARMVTCKVWRHSAFQHHLIPAYPCLSPQVPPGYLRLQSALRPASDKSSGCQQPRCRLLLPAVALRASEAAQSSRRPLFCCLRQLIAAELCVSGHSKGLCSHIRGR